MSDLSHTIKITADLSKVQAAASQLKAGSPSAEEIEKDPKGFLASIGVDIDDGTAAAIASRFASRSATVAPAAIIHIDV